ncbi:hypothetical protein ACOMHN_036022 [Nucella lapillus]
MVPTFQANIPCRDRAMAPISRQNRYHSHNLNRSPILKAFLDRCFFLMVQVPMDIQVGSHTLFQKCSAAASAVSFVRIRFQPVPSSRTMCERCTKRVSSQKTKNRKNPFTPTVVKIELDDSSESMNLEDNLADWPTIAHLASGYAELASGTGSLGSPHFGNNSSLGRTGEKRFQCLKCGATYAQSGSLGRHRRKCEGLFSLECRFCEQVFHRKDRFREHLLFKHDFVDPTLVNRRTAASALAWHCVPSQFKLEHLSPVEYVESEGEELIEPSFAHMATPLVSDVSAETSQAGIEKPFRCAKCGMAYAHQGSLVRHRHKCEGTLVLTCLFCKHKFHRKDKLREHFLNKHNYVDEALGPPGYTLMDPNNIMQKSSTHE